jgi:molybdenum cofactor synthesis domain-containing protein
MTALVARTAAALLIGNELLSGKIQEKNLIELARTLWALGVSLKRVAILPDEIETLAAALREASDQHDVVFTSGGIGPTHDDVTIAAVGRAFSLAIVTDPGLSAQIQNAYGADCTDAHLRMALVPEGAVLRTSPDVEWPTPVVHNVWILPGVPEIFRMKLDVVRTWLKGPEPFVSRALFTRLDEPAVQPLLDQVVSSHPAVEIGSYPKWFEPSYRTKITFDARDPTLVEAALSDMLGKIPSDQVVRVE